MTNEKKAGMRDTRGFLNVSVLVLILAALLILFIFYPMFEAFEFYIGVFVIQWMRRVHYEVNL
jgi:hypothetical protein